MQIKALPTLAIFGGSFNPVHVGHLGIVRALAVDPTVAGVIVVPARQSPFKRAAPPLPDDLRWRMLREALRGIAGVSLSDAELRRAAPSYTVDTLRGLAALLPTARLELALGWDAFAEFAGWHRAAEILSLAGLVLFDRAGTTAPGAVDPATWRPLLPPPWDVAAQPDGAGGLVTPDGRPLVRRLPLALPAIAGREILDARSAQDVPPGARELLAEHWRKAGAR